MRPSCTSRPSSAEWSVKKTKGALAAHSWPMNRSGVAGVASNRAEAAR